MRVGVIGLLHESNTFIAERTTLHHFRQDTLLTCDAVRDRFEGSPHEIGGFFAGLASEKITSVPIFAARAVPFGVIETETFLHLLEKLQSEVASAGQLDGILVAPHGATVCETIRDADGYWLAKLLEQVGRSTPIVGTLDAHANLSKQMVESTNALVAYRTNPHLDQFDRGVEAAIVLARTLRGEINPVQHAEFPPLAINIERQMTSEAHLTGLYKLADTLSKESGIVSNSILLGFPYADVEEMGSSVLVVTDNDQQLARSHAEKLADCMWQNRQQYVGKLTSIDEALNQTKSFEGPVCLLDMGDNVGGGSPGDSTHIIHTIRNRNLTNCFVCFFDPESVRQAIDAGIGSKIDMKIGGKTDKMHGEPYVDNFKVLGIYDGKFSESETRHGGFTDCDQGPSVVIKTADQDSLTVLLTTLRMPPFSLMQLTSCDIDPKRFQIIIAKGVNAPIAAYAPVCKHLIRVNSPGCTSADMNQLDFHHRRKPMFPFEAV